MYHLPTKRHPRPVISRLLEWLQRHPEGATARDLERAGIGRPAPAIRATLVELVELGAVVAANGPTTARGGRPTKRYLVAPWQPPAAPPEALASPSAASMVPPADEPLFSLPHHCKGCGQERVFTSNDKLYFACPACGHLLRVSFG